MNPKLIAAGALAATLLAAASAHADTFTFTTMMTGAAELLAVNTPAYGSAQVTFDDAALTVTVNETWANLLGEATVNHIHVATTPGGAGGVVLGFPIPNPSPSTGSFGGVFTLSGASFNSLLMNTNAGLAYVNLHSTAFGGGEIRGFLAAPVPEPETYALMALGLGVVGLWRRRRAV